jgi:hypothetical protein
MKLKGLTIDAHYIVVSPSTDGTLRQGDVIRRNLDGTISCLTAGGWLAAHLVAAALNGVTVRIDTDWQRREHEKAQARINWLAELGQYHHSAPNTVTTVEQIAFLIDRLPPSERLKLAELCKE